MAKKGWISKEEWLLDLAVTRTVGSWDSLTSPLVVRGPTLLWVQILLSEHVLTGSSCQKGEHTVWESSKTRCPRYRRPSEVKTSCIIYSLLKIDLEIYTNTQSLTSSTFGIVNFLLVPFAFHKIRWWKGKVTEQAHKILCYYCWSIPFGSVLTLHFLRQQSIIGLLYQMWEDSRTSPFTPQTWLFFRLWETSICSMHSSGISLLSKLRAPSLPICHH